MNTLASPKQQTRKLHASAREARMWAGEQVAKAAHCAADDDVEGFHRCMAEAGRLALISAKLTKQAREITD